MFIYIQERKEEKRENTMISNPFANYTLSITTQYHDTKAKVEEAQKQPPRKRYTSLDSMLEECFFLGATRFGTNFIA